MRRRSAPGWTRLALGAMAGAIVCAGVGLSAASLVVSATGPANANLVTGLLSTPALTPLSSLDPLGIGGSLPPTPTPPVISPPGTPTLPTCIQGLTCPTGGGSPTPGPATNPNSSSNGSGPGAIPGSSGGGRPGGTTSGGSFGRPSGAGAGSNSSLVPSGSLASVPPPSITLSTAVSSLSFGKAPFLWPLFVALDILGVGVVAIVLRKTWSKPVAD